MPAVQSIDNVTPGPVRVGTAWKETRKAGKRTMESTIQVALYRPPSQLGLQVDGKAMRGQMTFTLAPKEGRHGGPLRRANVGKGPVPAHERHDEPHDGRRRSRYLGPPPRASRTRPIEFTS